MKAICGGFWLILFLPFCLHVITASQSTRNRRNKRLSSNYCNSNAECKNGGLCELNSCRCPYGYVGNFCEIRLQCANDSDCFRRGKCDLDSPTNTTFCNCDQSNGRYEGVFCEKRLPCHALGYCLNDGLCKRDSVATNSFYCLCTDGFTGSNCQEKTFCELYDSCDPGGTCQYSYNFRNNSCLCDNRSGYTGYFCKLRITPALNYSAQFYWSFNRKIPEAIGAAKVVRDPQMGNVMSLVRTGGGFVDLGELRNSCMNNDFNTCQQGISFAFWLQFNDGVYVLSITKADSSILSVQVNNNSKLLVELQSGSNLWKIQRDCFPVGWVYVTVTWNYQKMLYYENGQLLSQSSAPVLVNMTLSQEASLLSVGSYKRLGGFSTMRINNLAFWTHALSKQEIKEMFIKKFSSPYTAPCLLNPCPSNQWCEEDRSKSSNFTCIEPTGYYCSFNSGYCQWRNASIEDHHWKLFSRYGSLRHDHTGNVCGGKFLGLVSHDQLRSEVTSRKFQNQSTPRRKVSISMWYYMEGWSEKSMSIIVLWNSTANVTLLSVKEQQSRQWNYLKTEFSANTSFQIILRGELLGSGGIFVDDIFINTYNLPVILSQKRSYSTNLQNTTVMDCVAAYSVNITWYRDKKPIKQGNHYVIKQGDLADKKVSSLEVKDADCEVAGNYACVAVSDHGVDQQQFTITILDLPRMPSNLKLDPSTKQITWTEDPRYQCLPKSHFVVEYKKSSSSIWTTAGYFDNKTFDLENPVKGKKYDVKVYAINSVGRSRGRTKSFFTNIEPSNIHFFVNHTAIENAKTVFVERGVPVNLRCQVTAEPEPRFILQMSSLSSVTFNRQRETHGITWEISLRIRSMSCRNSVFFSCMAYNLLGSSKVTVTLHLSEPDPPRTFRATFVNITAVVITWSAYRCNGMVKPSVLSVRFRREGHLAWIERNYTNPAKELTITGKFHYGTTYEFISRLVYDKQVGVFSPTFKTISPGFKLADLSNVTVTTHFTGQAGTAMTIYCTTVGPAALTFSWEKDNVTLKPSYWLKIDQLNSTCSVLTIRSTKKANSGNYTCTVSKSKTSITETVFVRVFEPPKVTITPLVRTLFEGESVTFHCDLLRGNISQLSIAWYEKAENSQEALIGNNNDSLSLTVGGDPPLEGKQTHVTYYRCTMQNTDGIGSSPLAKLVVLHKEDTAVCKRELHDGIMWSLTSPGVIDIQRCPNAIGHAVRPCLSTGQFKKAKWGQVDFSDCMSRQIIELHEEVLSATEGYIVNRNLRTILEDLENVTAACSAPEMVEMSRRMYGRDLKASVDALTKLIRYNAANGTKPLSNQHDMRNLVKTSSNLLRLGTLPAWKTALKIQDDLVYQIVLALDEYGHHSTLKTTGIHIVTENILLISVKVPVNSSESTNGLQITQGQSSLDLPSTLFSQSNNTVTVVSAFFSTLGHVFTSTEAHGTLNTSIMNDSDWFLNSKLASITIRPTTPDVIEPPFKLALETPKATPVAISRACVFLNITTHLTRARNNTWSTRGCHVVSSRTNSTTTTCACDHMTLFAVLMDSGNDQLLYSSHLVALSWISVVGCLLSLVGVIISVFVTVCFWKNLRSQRTVVLINLCVAIAITDVLIVAMEIADVQNQTSCTILAAFLHFFVLSIFCWMLSEGIQLYFSLVKILGANSDINIRIFYALGWGLPAFVVSVSLAATHGRGYANMQTCWLNSKNYVLWAFVAPALLIVSVNMIVFALVIKSLLSSHSLRKEPLIMRFKRGLKASFVLLPLLGIAWAFGVLTLASDKIVFNYIFAISNSLQGLLIFVFHCVLNKQIREALSERKRRRARIVTDAITGQSNRKLSTTTGEGTSGHHSSSTGLRLFSLQLFRSEICPSPQSSPRISRAFEETALDSAEASPVISRPDRTNLLQTKRPTTGGKNREKGTKDHAKDETTLTQSTTSNTSSNACDMDERDLTSSESSFETIEYRGLENPREKQGGPQKKRRCAQDF